MKNKIAIFIAASALLACVVGLGSTIHAVWPTDDGAEVVEPNFVVHDSATEPAVEEPAQVAFDGPMPGQVGPTMGDDEEAAPEPDPPKTKTTAKRKPVVTKTRTRQEDWKPAVLQIVTNFDAADVTVNGIDYPEYVEPGQPEGMVLPAGGPYQIEVKHGENVKMYRLNLRAYETRLLLVDLTGFNSSAPPPAAPKPAKKAEEKKEEKEDDKDDKKKQGKITVYSKPAGVVVVDGKDTGEKTPGSVDLDNGRHEVQVKYETGSISEKKIVRVRSGSRIKLFFRERK